MKPVSYRPETVLSSLGTASIVTVLAAGMYALRGLSPAYVGYLTLGTFVVTTAGLALHWVRVDDDGITERRLLRRFRVTFTDLRRVWFDPDRRKVRFVGPTPNESIYINIDELRASSAAVNGVTRGLRLAAENGAELDEVVCALFHLPHRFATVPIVHSDRVAARR